MIIDLMIIYFVYKEIKLNLFLIYIGYLIIGRGYIFGENSYDSLL